MSEQILEIGKIRKALKSFNQAIKVDVNTIGAKQEDKEPQTEKELISKVKLNFLDDEWGETVEALAEAGLDLEAQEETEEENKTEIKVKKLDPLKDIKEKEEQRAELVNLILDYSIANKMAFKDIEEAIEIVCDLYLSDGLINRKES